MKYLKLYENFGLLPGDTDKNLEEVMQEYINWDLIEDMKHFGIDYIDDGLSVSYIVYLGDKSNKGQTPIIKGEWGNDRSTWREFEADFSDFDFKYKHIRGITYKDILNRDFKISYTINVFGELEDGMRLSENIFGKQEAELLRKLKLEYPDEEIHIEDPDYTSEYY